MSSSKRCNRCGNVKPLEDFYRHGQVSDGRRPECKACTASRRKQGYAENRQPEIDRVKAWQRENPERYAARMRQWRSDNPERKKRMDRAGHLKRKYGITQADYDRMLEEQGFGCAICGDIRPGGRTFHVDHDHATGEVRGLLCVKCNQGIGLLRENPALLFMASEYLQGRGAVLMERMEQTRLARHRLEGLGVNRQPRASGTVNTPL